MTELDSIMNSFVGIPGTENLFKAILVNRKLERIEIKIPNYLKKANTDIEKRKAARRFAARFYDAELIRAFVAQRCLNDHSRSRYVCNVNWDSIPISVEHVPQDGLQSYLLIYETTEVKEWIETNVVRARDLKQNSIPVTAFE